MLSKWFGFMLNSTNPKATCEKYTKMTGIEPVEEWEGFYSLDFNGNKLFIVFAPEDGDPYLVFETDNIDQESERLKQEGFDVGFSFDVAIGKFTFFEDADKIQYGLFQRS